jgi:hypothetical protein
MRESLYGVMKNDHQPGLNGRPGKAATASRRHRKRCLSACIVVRKLEE